LQTRSANGAREQLPGLVMETLAALEGVLVL
jgi:hypothetical protein